MSFECHSDLCTVFCNFVFHFLSWNAVMSLRSREPLTWVRAHWLRAYTLNTCVHIKTEKLLLSGENRSRVNICYPNWAQTLQSLSHISAFRKPLKFSHDMYFDKIWSCLHVQRISHSLPTPTNATLLWLTWMNEHECMNVWFMRWMYERRVLFHSWRKGELKRRVNNVCSVWPNRRNDWAGVPLLTAAVHWA